MIYCENRLTTADKLSNIEASPVRAIWSTPRRGETQPGVFLSLPHGSYLERCKFDRDCSRIDLLSGTLRVEDVNLRGYKIGERLIKALGYLAYKYDYKELVADVVSQYSLDILGRVFSKDAITIDQTHGSEWGLLPAADFNQARDSLEAIEAFEHNSEERENGVLVNVDLQKINMRLWEPPTEFALERFDWSI
jgi:hypothetical protein